MRKLDGHPELCAVNTATFGFQQPLEQVIEEVARAGFGGIAPWRREVEGKDVPAVTHAHELVLEAVAHALHALQYMEDLPDSQQNP